MLESFAATTSHYSSDNHLPLRNAAEIPATYEQVGLKKGKSGGVDGSANAAIRRAETEQKLMEYQETIQVSGLPLLHGVAALDGMSCMNVKALVLQHKT